MSNNTRKYDVVLYGATGYTGKLCAEVLSKHPSKPRWAIAGRDDTRLQALRKQLNLSESVGTIAANNNDVNSLHAMLEQTSSIVNVVGPFRQMGAEKIVKACTETGTHYFDLSGETGFNATIQKYDEAAKAKKIVIAPSVGFDSLPFDLSTYLAASHLKTKQKGQIGSVEVTAIFKGGISGGTIQSALDMTDVDKAQMQAVRSDWLSPMKGSHKPMQSSLPFYSAPFQKYGIFTPFTLHNTRIVNQTAGLLRKSSSPDQYGPKFVYKDGFIMPNVVVAWIATIVLRISLFVQMYFSPIRWLIRRLIPRNSGPSTKNIWKQGLMDLAAVAHSSDGKKKSISRIYATGEPGYSSTAQMIVECALFVVQDPTQLHPLAKQGGILTGALLGADRLADRLVQNANWTIEKGQSYDGKSRINRIKEKSSL